MKNDIDAAPLWAGTQYAAQFAEIAGNADMEAAYTAGAIDYLIGDVFNGRMPPEAKAIQSALRESTKLGALVDDDAYAEILFLINAGRKRNSDDMLKFGLLWAGDDLYFRIDECAKLCAAYALGNIGQHIVMRPPNKLHTPEAREYAVQLMEQSNEL